MAAKKLAYCRTDEHPDGAGLLSLRMQDELADVAAISAFVIEKFGLDRGEINARIARKLATFKRWDSEPDAPERQWITSESENA